MRFHRTVRKRLSAWNRPALGSLNVQSMGGRIGEYSFGEGSEGSAQARMATSFRSETVAIPTYARDGLHRMAAARGRAPSGMVALANQF